MAEHHQPRDEVRELLARIIAECMDPARWIELYYWSAEPQLAEVMRQYIAMPSEARSALHAFLTAGDSGSVTVRISSKGEMIFSFVEPTGLASESPKLGIPPSVVH